MFFPRTGDVEGPTDDNLKVGFSELNCGYYLDLETRLSSIITKVLKKDVEGPTDDNLKVGFSELNCGYYLDLETRLSSIITKVLKMQSCENIWSCLII